MQSAKIKLDTVEKVKGFVSIVAPLEGDIDIVSERYVIDANSIMGIFSLDLSKTLELKIYDAETAERVLPLIKPYVV